MFNNNWTLCRFVLRRGRIGILFWLIGFLALIVGFGSGIGGMYPDQASLDVMAVTLESPAMLAMMGPAYMDGGLLTLGGLYTVLMLVWCAVGFGIMNIFLVVRHTRQDEERGRIELIRSLPAGRMANLSSTLTAAALINVLFVLAVGLLLGLTGDWERGMDIPGAFTFAASCGVIGLVMAGVTAVFCQLNKYPSTAKALSLGFLFLLYVVFMLGSMQKSEAVSNLSLIGLAQRSKPMVENSWTPIFILLAIAAVLALSALWLCKIRDLGESLIPSRPGKRDAKPYLKSPGGLAWRLLKTPFIVWLFIIPILSAAYGSVMGDLDSLIGSNELFYTISGGDPLRMASFFLLIMGISATLPALHFILKARDQEKRGFLENILARSVSRADHMRGYFILSLIAAAVMPLINALGFYAGSVPVMENPVSLGRWVLACAVYTPAILVILGVAMLLIAYLPKRAGLAWGYLGFSFLVLYLGRMMDLPEWTEKLSPFGHIPADISALGDVSYDGFGGIAAMGVMTALATVMFIFGFIGYGRRDMEFSH